MRRTTVKIRRLSLPLPLLLSLALVACGSETAVNSPPSPTSVTPTVTPATDTPATDTPATGIPAVGVEIDYEPHASIDELVDDSDLVVLGTVTDAVSLGRPFLAQDPSAHEFVAYTFHIDEHLTGGSIDTVTLAWDAFTVGSGGERVGEVVMNGVRAPRLGDTVLLYLRQVDPAFAAAMGGTPTHQPVALDGVVHLGSGTAREATPTARRSSRCADARSTTCARRSLPQRPSRYV